LSSSGAGLHLVAPNKVANTALWESKPELVSTIKALDVVGYLAHNLKAAGSNPAPATKISSLIKDFKAERNARLLSFAVYINATSTTHQKNCTRTLQPAIAGIDGQR